MVYANLNSTIVIWRPSPIFSHFFKRMENSNPIARGEEKCRKVDSSKHLENSVKSVKSSYVSGKVHHV